MSNNKSKKQARVLYVCFIIMIITAAILVAVTSTANKSRPKGEPAPAPEQEATGRETRDISELFPGIKGRGDGKNDSKDDGDSGEKDKKEDAGLVPDDEDGKDKIETAPPETEKTDVEPETVTFTLPVDGGLINPHSLKVPVFSATMNDYRTHTGVDLESGIGGEVRAVADGTVEEVWEDPMMGWSLRISHAGGFESVYRNLSPDFPEGIEKGAAVSSGQVVAAVGGTALIECEEEPHLHFELRVAGESVDPSEHIGFEPVSAEFED